MSFTGRKARISDIENGTKQENQTISCDSSITETTSEGDFTFNFYLEDSDNVI